MISKEELEKLTVPQLREKLKSRKLTLSGTKAEIINRLYENILAEETLLGKPEADNTDFDLTNVDVDEVLADELPKKPISNVDKAPVDETPKKPIINSEKILTDEIPKKPTSNADESLGDEVTPKKPITAPTIEEEKRMLERAKRFGLPCKETKSNTTEAIKARAIRFGTGDPECVKKEQRSKRFSIEAENTTSANPKEDEILAKRAKRFGPVNV